MGLIAVMNLMLRGMYVMIIVDFSWAWVLGIPDLYSIVSFSGFGERRGSYDG